MIHKVQHKPLVKCEPQTDYTLFQESSSKKKYEYLVHKHGQCRSHVDLSAHSSNPTMYYAPRHQFEQPDHAISGGDKGTLPGLNTEFTHSSRL